MTEIAKIVQDRLRATQPDQAHPDANLLTAFAEQTLSETEREGVLEHLALCGDCREVIVIALPAADVAAIPAAAETEAVQIKRRQSMPGQAKPEGSWLNLVWPSLARPNLRWAALAAGVVLAASLLLVHPGKIKMQPGNPNQAMVPSANRQSVPTALASESQISSSSAPSAEVHLPMQLNTGSRPAGKQSAPAAPEPSETLIARNDAPPIEKAKPAPQGTETPGAEAQETDTNEQQKTDAAAAPGLAPSQSRNAMSTARFSSLASPSLAQHNATWTITAGVLQRSLDSGQSWQNVLHADHPLLCYASHGDEVWTGGHAGTLFHSINDGVTWVQVQPSIKTQQLAADITQIDLRSATQIVVSTTNNEIWSSADGGKTWQKK